MAKKKHGKSSVLKDFGFVFAVLVLLAALGGVYYLHRLQVKERKEELDRIISNEVAPGINSSKILSDVIEETTQADTGVIEEGTDSEPVAEAGGSHGQESVKDSAPQKKEDSGQEEEKPAEEAAETEEVSETAEDADQGEAPQAADGIKDATVIVLNGSYRNGVASVWEERMKEAGYNNIITGSYGGQAEQKTIVYTAYPDQAEVLKEIFADAEIREGTPPAAYTLSGETPEKCDYYVVIGLTDANVQ